MGLGLVTQVPMVAGLVCTYKTKGTVLVFSWCGSGSIMPQKCSKVRKTEIRNGSCSDARWQHGRGDTVRIFFSVVCAQL